jgi:zona occludens toxin
MAKTGQAEEVMKVETTESSTIVPVTQQVQSMKVINNEPVKSFMDIQLLTANIDWSQVSACLSSKNGCVCYGLSAERIIVPKESCELAVSNGWSKKKYRLSSRKS